MQEISTGTTQTIYDIDFASPSTGFAVGGEKFVSNVILKTIDGGQSWILDESVEGQSLLGIDMLSDSVAFATGRGGQVLRTLDGGLFWDAFQHNSYAEFTDISAFDIDKAVVVGSRNDTGVLMMSQSEWWIFDWEQQEEVMYKTLFVNEYKGWAMGNGFLKKTTNGGATWHYSEAKNDRFISIDFPTQDVGFVCGFQGSIWRTIDGGNSWHEIEKNNKVFAKRTHFLDIDFWDENLGMVVGHDGAIYYTDNGGDDWQKVKMNSSSVLRAVAFADESTIIVAGNGGKMWQILL